MPVNASLLHTYQPADLATYRLDISRITLLEDSFGQVMSLHPCEMRQWMRVQFLNEPGVDAGGIEREWFILVTQVGRKKGGMEGDE